MIFGLKYKNIPMNFVNNVSMILYIKKNIEIKIKLTIKLVN